MKKTDKHRPTYGQSYLTDNGIAFSEKGEYSLDIDEIKEMYDNGKRLDRLRQSGQYGEYLKNRLKELKEKESYLQHVETYNARLYNYPTGQHVTLYNNPVPIGKKNINLTKAYQNEHRTKEGEKHCIDTSLSRTKNVIYNIARSNEWKWFITLTLSPDKVDRSSYDEVVKRLQKFCNNLQQRHCPHLKYLIVPELHLDKINYHFHGLLADCDELQFVFSGKFDKKGRPVFNIPQWTYGFTTATLVGDTSRASSYITKYVTKESEQYLKNKHRYYTNRNTLRAPAEKLVVQSPMDFIQTYADDITYIKEVTVKPAHRKCIYLEMPYDAPKKKKEDKENEQ